MVFSGITFLYVFLPIVLILYFVLPRRFQNLYILLSGLIFYAWGEPFYVFVLIFSTLIDYFIGLFMHKFDHNQALRRVALIVSIVMNFSLLGLFKYSSFVVGELNHFFGLEIGDPGLHLPIGISFYTFQTLSYTIDLYLRNIKVQKNPINFAAFVTLFPQIVAGPIVRYEHVAKELDERSQNLDMVYEGIVTFITGLGKKVLIANNIGALWSAIKIMPLDEMPLMTAWLGIFAFTFQIYFDFSGYSDMAIGLGKVLGFNFPQNFNYPYISKSISEFWQRWHITLGAWFKSYVYFPMGGNRKGTGRTVFNLAVVWLFTGIWHGASWNFILWGVLYGVVVIAEKLFLGKLLEKIPSVLRSCYTMLLVILGWVLFDTPDLPTAGGYIGVMFGFGEAGLIFDSMSLYYLTNYALIFIVCVMGSTDFIKRVGLKIESRSHALLGYSRVAAQSAVLLLTTAYLVDAGYNPFLYFNF
ncbi:MAG: MBOAT family protein [Oscillospiraceae bacterium]|nr:MBOAT family protein [Oscillospiraceae bacterium]